MTEIWTPPTYTDLRTAEFQVSPFTCEDCGKKLNFKHPNRDLDRPKFNRVMLSGGYKQCLCGDCLANRITRWFHTPKAQLTNKFRCEWRKRQICDCCNKNRIVATVIQEPWLDVRFRSRWWNGHWICQDCLTQCARHGKEDSGIGGYDKGKHYSMNEAGARIG